MLVFPLKKEWYEKIKSGEKTIEYREVKEYWSKRIYSELSKEFERRFNTKFCSYEDFTFSVVKCEEDAKLKCKLRLGYTNRYMTANITKIVIVDGNNTDLHIDMPVYAIHLADVKEIVPPKKFEDRILESVKLNQESYVREEKQFHDVGVDDEFRKRQKENE